NLRSIDYLFIVSDPSARGIMTARRIADITEPLQLEIKKQYLLVNRTPDPIPPALQAKIDEAVAEADMELAGIISSSDDLIHQELNRASYLDLPDNSAVIEQVFTIFDALFAQAE
ncbi:carbon monoxide dehydrogenase, partial [Desulfobulbus sp. TB]|nr:carbon monoxide dehydrogenase [Desulfobulbus sp. TB]